MKHVKIKGKNVSVETVRISLNVAKVLGLEEVTGEGWESLPKGWTEESVKKFWASLTGDRVHKITACIKKLKGKVDNPEAFCSSLVKKVDYKPE